MITMTCRWTGAFFLQRFSLLFQLCQMSVLLASLEKRGNKTTTIYIVDIISLLFLTNHIPHKETDIWHNWNLNLFPAHFQTFTLLFSVFWLNVWLSHIFFLTLHPNLRKGFADYCSIPRRTATSNRIIEQKTTIEVCATAQASTYGSYRLSQTCLGVWMRSALLYFIELVQAFGWIQMY